MKIVVFTGAGISRESGIATFRDLDGLWASYRIEDVCTPEALVRNREGVIDFYNMRRREVLTKEPNAAHRALVELERNHDVEVITQNIDDLHERAGSTRVTHLHGEVRKLRSSRDELATVPIEGWEQRYDTRHPDGSLLRPFVVFFGESVPMLDRAIEIARTADRMIVVGTSLQVYPAASLVHYLRPDVPIWIVDPNIPDTNLKNLHVIQEPASTGVVKVVEELILTINQ
jgi:NAD-dependent deacetylase